ncbi:mitochondrial tRNA-specific 2-thiouridylase 1 isoform X2 [Epargyreus clarus]|uniref:mitochondrial tRNA-specific 2-thiouridylase 1 isoform X2 n=1 Tax=Epargyreus clarus TaxID=520877 RepID=UPI003C2D5174
MPNNLGIDAIATGHYANTSFGPYLENYREDEGARLLQPVDTSKDQTFFLSQVKQFSLRKCMFPLANILKTKVRQIARDEGLLQVANKKDSTGICFIGKTRFKDFIDDFIQPKKGLFIDIDTGQTVGEHDGIHKWTVGQRCHLCSHKEAYFVFQKEQETNNIYVVSGTKHPALWNNLCITNKPHWINIEPPELKNNSVLHCTFRFQHIKPLVPCRVVKNPEGLTILLEHNLRALTEGQFGALYKDNECLGSAKLLNIVHNVVY